MVTGIELVYLTNTAMLLCCLLEKKTMLLFSLGVYIAGSFSHLASMGMEGNRTMMKEIRYTLDKRCDLCYFQGQMEPICLSTTYHRSLQTTTSCRCLCLLAQSSQRKSSLTNRPTSVNVLVCINLVLYF